MSGGLYIRLHRRRIAEPEEGNGGGPVKIENVIGAVAIASIFSPLFSNNVVESYDVDLSGAVSLDE